MKLDIIVPLFNEEENIKNIFEKTNEALKGIKHNFIFIDDGSKDKTLNVLKEIYNEDSENVKIISFSRNYGKEAAMYAGLNNSKGDFVCIIDGDLQQDPLYLVKMYNFLIENEEYDSICMCQKQKKDRFLQRCFYKVMGKMSNLNMVEGASDFRMFRKSMVNAILKLNEKNRFSKGIFDYVGFNTYYDSYKVKNRAHGETKWSKKQLFNYAFNGIVAFSTKPLRISTYTGLFTSFLAFLYLIFIIIKAIVTASSIPGYCAIMCILLFIGGIQLIVMGIIGEYLGKTYEEVKNRPIYIEKTRLGFDEDFL